MSNSTVLYEFEDLLFLHSNTADPPLLSNSSDTGNASVLFDLQEVASAVATFLRNSFFRVRVEISNLCDRGVPIFGNKEQFQKVLTSVISCMGKTMTFGSEVINVIIHELRRPTDANFLPSGKKFLGENDAEMVRSKYIAVSVKRMLTPFEGRPSSDGRDGKGDVSYYDGGVIVKVSPAMSVIYLLKSESD